MSSPDYSSFAHVQAALSQVFSKAQTHKRAHGKLCSALLTVRRQTLAARPAVCFFDAFVQCVHRLLVVKAREPAVERCVEVRALSVMIRLIAFCFAYSLPSIVIRSSRLFPSPFLLSTGSSLL